MLTVEKDSGHTIANAHCLRPVLSPKNQAHAARMTTRLHISSQPEKVTTCFVLTDCSDDSGTLADKADQNVLLPKESTGQTFLTPTASIASIAVDTRTENVSGVCAADHDDEPCLTETDYKSGWDTRFKSGVYRGMPNEVVLRDYPEKVEPPIEVKSVSRIVREFLPRTQEHHRIDATTSTLQRKTGAPTFVALRSSEWEEKTRKGSKEYAVKTTRKIRGTVRKMRHTSRLDSTTGSKTRADTRKHSPHMTGKNRADHGILFCVRSTMVQRHQTATEGWRTM